MESVVSHGGNYDSELRQRHAHEQQQEDHEAAQSLFGQTDRGLRKSPSLLQKSGARVERWFRKPMRWLLEQDTNHGMTGAEVQTPDS